MHHLLTSLILSLTLLLVSTSAAPAKQEPRPWKVHRNVMHTTASNPKIGVVALDRTYRKYNLTPPEGVRAAAVKAKADAVVNTADTAANEKLTTGGGGTGIGIVTATPYVHNAAYLSPVSIGGQPFDLVLDTGSADLYVFPFVFRRTASTPSLNIPQQLADVIHRWVFNTGLAESDKTNHTVYDAAKSSTFKSLSGASFNVSYADGSSTSGIVGTETVTVGGITVVGQAIELPTLVSDDFTNDYNSDGVLGLAFGSTNDIKPSPLPTFFENAAPYLQNNLFTANLKTNAPGNYQFGIIDTTAFKNTLQYAPINGSQGFWQFGLTGYTIGSGSFQQDSSLSPAIADTGSSILFLDPKIVKDYYAGVEHATDSQGVIFPCNTKLPDFEFGFGNGFTATISGSLFNYSIATGAPASYVDCK